MTYAEIEADYVIIGAAIQVDIEELCVLIAKLPPDCPREN